MMEQLSLFGDLEPDKKESPKTKPAPVTETSTPRVASSLVPHHDMIIDCARDGYTVKQICRHLIKHKSLSSETYSQGTLKLYPQLMIYFKHLQENALVKLAKIDPAGNGDFIDYNDQFTGRKCDAIFTVIER